MREPSGTTWEVGPAFREGRNPTTLGMCGSSEMAWARGLCYIGYSPRYICVDISPSYGHGVSYCLLVP